MRTAKELHRIRNERFRRKNPNYWKKYYRKNPEKFKRYFKTYFSTQKGKKVHQNAQARYAKKKESRKLNRKTALARFIWKKNNPDYWKKWNADNPDYQKNYQKNYNKTTKGKHVHRRAVKNHTLKKKSMFEIPIAVKTRR